MGSDFMTYRVIVYPVVHTTYDKQQESVFEHLRGNQLHVSGDGHSDSPRYSVSYATYLLWTLP